MESYTVRCKNASLCTDLFGAQLNSFCIGNRQYIWQRNQNVWRESAPVLFPIIGELKGEGKTTVIDGKAYHMPIHGFAKRSAFKVAESEESSVTLMLESHEETLKSYPFSFELLVKFTVTENGFSQTFTVKNKDEKDMPFFIGAHPGFCVPMFEGDCFEDYTVRFEKTETVGSYRIDEDGLVNEQVTEPVFNGNEIPLSRKLFHKGALVFEGLKSRSVSLLNKNGHGVKMNFDGFDYFGIWQMPDVEPDYLCLEPWTGMNDCYGEDGVYAHKRGCKTLKSGEQFSVGYTVTAV